MASKVINPRLYFRSYGLEVIKWHLFAKESLLLQCRRKSEAHSSKNIYNLKELN